LNKRERVYSSKRRWSFHNNTICIYICKTGQTEIEIWHVGVCNFVLRISYPCSSRQIYSKKNVLSIILSSI
jgi:hypothetical protein